MNAVVGLARALPAVWVAAPLPWPGRLVLVALLTAVAWPALPASGNLFSELLVGLTLGLVASVPFRAAQAAGATLGRTASGRGQPLGDAFGLFALALFAGAGGPLLVARAWGESYLALPVGSSLTITRAVEAGARLIATAIALSLPGLGALLAAEVMGGLLRKAQPDLPGAQGLRLAVVLLAVAAGVGAIVTILAGAGLASPLMSWSK